MTNKSNEIKQAYWNVVDFNKFRAKFPELQINDTTSITAIIRSKTTPLIDLATKENKDVDGKSFVVRLKEYKAELKNLFDELDKKEVEFSKVESPKNKM